MTPSVGEIDARALDTARKDAVPPIVIDVRHAWELAQAALPGARHVPLASLVAQSPEALAALPEDKAADVVMMCHHGMRSAKAAQVLVALGYTQVRNLVGGIDAWSRDVDAQVARY